MDLTIRPSTHEVRAAVSEETQSTVGTARVKRGMAERLAWAA